MSPKVYSGIPGTQNENRKTDFFSLYSKPTTFSTFLDDAQKRAVYGLPRGLPRPFCHLELCACGEPQPQNAGCIAPGIPFPSTSRMGSVFRPAGPGIGSSCLLCPCSRGWNLWWPCQWYPWGTLFYRSLRSNRATHSSIRSENETTSCWLCVGLDVYSWVLYERSRLWLHWLGYAEAP